jgi:hypothetical protein
VTVKLATRISPFETLVLRALGTLTVIEQDAGATDAAETER